MADADTVYKMGLTDEQNGKQGEVKDLNAQAIQAQLEAAAQKSS